MVIYLDILSGDELFSDAKRVERDLEDLKGVCRVPVKRMSQSNAIDDFVYGGNASAEGEDAGGGAADGDTVGLDIVLFHKLKLLESFHIPMENKERYAVFKDYFKKFSRALEEKLQEGGKEGQKKADEWKTHALAICKFILKNYGEIDFYGGANFDVGAPDKHSICFLTYGDDGLENYMYFIEHSLLEKKV